MDKHSRKGSVQGRRERDEAFEAAPSRLNLSHLVYSNPVVVCVHRFLRYRPAEQRKKKEWQCMPSGEGWLGESSLLYRHRTQPADQGLLGQLRRRHASHPQQVDVALLYPPEPGHVPGDRSAGDSILGPGCLAEGNGSWMIGDGDGTGRRSLAK